MPTVREIFDTIESWAPLSLQMSFDNAGFLLGHGDRQVTRCLLALDVTVPVIEEAAALGAELIVAHHPLIFDPLRSLTDEGDGRKALMLAEKGVAVVCMHTNLDIASGGVNDVLIRLLGAEPEEALDADGCGRVGTLPAPLPMEDFLARCKTRLQCAGLRYHDAGRSVRRLAVMGGAGGSALRAALEKDCDTYVTADVKYHVFLDAAEQGINLIDADHFCTENPVIPELARRLREVYPQVVFAVSRVHGQTARFF